MSIGNPGSRVKRILLYVLLVFMLFMFLFPAYWIVVSSLQGSGVLFSKQLNFFPVNPTLSNFMDLFSKGRFYIAGAMINSIKISLATTIVCLGLSVFSSYAFARIKFRGSMLFFYLLIMTEMLPPISFLIPFFVIFKKLHLLNTWYGAVVGYTAWLLPITTWILYGYFKTLPKDLEDSGRVDGCTRVQVLLRVILPVSLPGMVASGTICFVFAMGEFLFALTILTQQKVRTLPIALASFVSKYTIEYGKISASAVLTFIFPVVFMLIFQQYMVKGLTAGAVKG